MDVIVTWEDESKNCVNASELKPVEKNMVIALRTKVKMRYKFKWYYGIVTAIEDSETGDIKTWKPERRLSNESACSEDNLPLSMLIQKRTLATQTKEDKLHTQYSSDQENRLDSMEEMHISELNEPDYQPERSFSPTVLQQYQETTVNQTMKPSSEVSFNNRNSNVNMTTDAKDDSNLTHCSTDLSNNLELTEYHDISDLCEVSYCNNDIFNSCNRCFLFLCYEHFEKNVACNMHGKIFEEIVPIPCQELIEPHSVLKSSQSVLGYKEINDDKYQVQTCEVPECFEDVFSTCFKCNILLCWNHFEGETSCDIHQKNPDSIQNMPVDVEIPANNCSESNQQTNLSNNTITNDVETLYPVEGSRREFDLLINKKVDKRKQAKILRNTGQAYESAAKKKVPAKNIGPFCNVIHCKENKRDCYLFTDSDREVIFRKFYSTTDATHKRDFILRHITENRPKYKSLPKGTVSRRKRTLKYYFSSQGTKFQVCRTFFLNTLAVSEKFVRNTLDNMFDKSGILRQENRGGRVESLKQRDIKINKTIQDHINRFPRVESHYCRANTTKEYLNSSLNIKKMHRMLVNDLLPNDAPSLTCYKKVFRSMNLAFHHPKKDLCSLCAAYHDGSPDTKDTLKEKYNKHILEKNTVRDLKEKDKKEASSKNSKTICASFDLQQVIYLPITKEGAIFYKRQLSIYNFTIYDIADRDCYCFTWPEIESRRGSSEIATAVCQFINEHDVAGTTTISLYADGCAGQNKNSIVASALLHSINNATNLQTITLKFFAPNHGQNEGDSAHSAISYALQRSGDIFLPSQLYPIIQMERSSQPYIVRPMQYSDFKDYKELSQNIKILSLRKDNESGAPINWTEAVEFMVDKETPTSLFFKTSHIDTNYRSITVKRSLTKFLKEPIGPLNHCQIKISKPKYEDLMSLCTGDTAIIRIPEYKHFYTNLPHE